MLRHLKKPVLTVLRWQLAATAVLMLIAALVAGGHGAASALAGGLVSITAGLAAAFAGSVGNAKSAGGVMFSGFRGQGGKARVTRLALLLRLLEHPQAGGRAPVSAFC